MAWRSSIWALFQSTLPVRGGTYKGLIDLAYRSGISIHPPREGRDEYGLACVAACFHFNPPSP